MFEAPAHPVKGRTAVDQGWIDDAIESGVAACGWPRPTERLQALWFAP